MNWQKIGQKWHAFDQTSTGKGTANVSRCGRFAIQGRLVGPATRSHHTCRECKREPRNNA